MYIIDTSNNKLVKATPCTFKSLGFEGRKNLQEWIAKEPSCLGEDLLIIQKEIDGFSDTRERLDLLTQNISKDKFQFVPLQDFSHPWTDSMLYEKYGLTEDEIAFIESMIRPMD